MDQKLIKATGIVVLVLLAAMVNAAALNYDEYLYEGNIEVHGHLEPYLIYPTEDIRVAQNEYTGRILKSRTGYLNVESSNYSEIILTSSDNTTFNYKNYPTKNGNFSLLTIEGYGFTSDVGKPKLPVIREMIRIPYGVNYDLEIIDFKVEEYSLKEFNITDIIIPVQEPIEKIAGAGEDASFIFDEKTYERDTYLIDKIATVGDEGIIRGQSFILVEIFPIDYNPVSGKIKIYKEIRIRIKFDNSDPLLDKQRMERYSSIPFNVLTQKLFINPSTHGEEHSISGKSIDIGYLIITDPVFESNLLEFIQWKERKGYDVTLVTTTETGSSKEDIKNYIENAYYTWITPPTYVLLVGDTGNIPYWTGYGPGNPATDLYYATLEGSDYFPDVGIGRFSVDSTGQIENLIDKTIPDNELKYGVFMASEDNYHISEGTHNYVISNYLTPDNWNADKLYSHTYSATTEQVSEAINDGRSIAVYSGHGSDISWGDGPPFTQSDIHALVNGIYPAVFSFACYTGNFPVPESFGETWIRDDHGGSAFFGSSVTSYWDEDDILEKKIFEGCFDQNLTPISSMIDYGKIGLYGYYGDTGTVQRYFEMYNILGDPAIEFRYLTGVDDPPVAGFSATPTSGDAPLTVEFTDLSTNNPTEWSWDFGDGGTSTEQDPSHEYTAAGTYTVSLTATNAYGSDDEEKTDYITASEADDPAVVEWYKTFGGEDSDSATSVQQTLDGGYIIAGDTHYGAGGSDFWLIKTDSEGEHVWDKTFGDVNYDVAWSVQQTQDGGYIIAGETYSYGAGDDDVWLIKTDSNGVEQWDKTFGGTNWDRAHSVQQTQDGGYIITGVTESYGAGNEDAWLIKTNSMGEHEWDKTFGGEDYDWANSVQQTRDGGYIIAGYTKSYGKGDRNVWLIKTDAEGKHEWDKTFGGAGDDAAYSIQQTQNGGYILAGYTDSGPLIKGGSDDILLVKICGGQCSDFDLNGDHEVDMGDLFAITKSGYWGCYPGCEPGYEDFDLNTDGAVDMGDLFAVTKSGYWGEECS